MQKGLPLVAHSNFLIVKTSSFSIQLHTSENVLETGDSLWHGSLELVKYLLQNPELVRDRNVLELGAGLGLVGIVSAALGATSVTITDLECQQSLIQQNVQLNESLWSLPCSSSSSSNNIIGDTVSSIPEYNNKVITRVHRFGEFNAEWETGKGKYDIILASDIGYDVELHEPAALSLRHFIGMNSANSSCTNNSGEYNSWPCKVVLVEEVRWKDIYTWYKEALVKHCCQFGSRALVETNIEKDNIAEPDVTISVLNADGTQTDVPFCQHISPIMLLTL